MPATPQPPCHRPRSAITCFEVLEQAGLSAAECAALVDSGAVRTDDPASFAWAPVRANG